MTDTKTPDTKTTDTKVETSDREPHRVQHDETPETPGPESDEATFTIVVDAKKGNQTHAELESEIRQAISRNGHRIVDLKNSAVPRDEDGNPTAREDTSKASTRR